MNEDMNCTISEKNSWKFLLLILILATFFRLWGTFDLNEYIEDEAIHIPNAISLGSYGTTANWNWHHPQLSGLIIYSTISIFGDNPIGWRSSNAFFGTTSVLLLFLIARLIYNNSSASLIAATLLGLDPFHIYLSRTTYMEIPATFFFLLYLYLMLEYTEKKRNTLPLAGIAMGLTIAVKAYFVFAIPLVVAYSAYKIQRRSELSRTIIIDFIFSLLLLPVTVYLMLYFQWFSRGYTLNEFFQMKSDAIWELQKNTLASFANKDFVEAGGKPWEWFIKPMFWGHQRLSNIEEGRFLLQCNNPPFRLLALPSLCIATLYAWKKQLIQELLPPLLFCSCYLLILSAQRPMFSYSSTALLPFAYLAISRAATLYAIRINREKLIYSFFISAAVIWGAYMFPLISARLIPVSPFRPILSMVRYMGNF